MKILAIETSCDETAMAVIEAKGGLKNPSFKVLKNLVSSQIKVHRPFGGVVPNLAKREHLKNLPILFRKLNPKPYTLNPDLIAVTVGPGLEPALWTGINFAKELHKTLNPKSNTLYPKIIGVNHMEGHLYSFLLSWQKKTVISPPEADPPPADNFQFPISKNFPAIALVVSGGHTILLKMDSLVKWKKLGETRDDAAGEAFDKVARLLNLPYPGGPEVEKLAKRGNPKAIDFPRPMIHDKNFEFSFSGLKTSVLYYLRDLHNANDTKKSANDAKISHNSHEVSQNSYYAADIAASFQQAVIDVLVKKTIRAAREFGAKSVLLCGGVAANKALRESLKLQVSSYKLKFFVPDFKYNTDNAAMIAAAGYINFLRKRKYKIIAQPNLNL